MARNSRNLNNSGFNSTHKADVSSVYRVETDAPSMMFEIANDNQISNDYCQLV